jgi:hypothetical protein
MKQSKRFLLDDEDEGEVNNEHINEQNLDFKFD